VPIGGLGPAFGGAQLGLDLLELGEIEIGQHPTAVGQRDNLVLQHPPVGPGPFLRRAAGFADLGNPVLDIAVPFGIGHPVQPPVAI
jgi:hypothetical protein